jgi:hypothetical protein
VANVAKLPELSGKSSARLQSNSKAVDRSVLFFG